MLKQDHLHLNQILVVIYLFDLYNKIPNSFVKISESGIIKVESILRLKEVGYQGFLIGENFMKTNDPGESASRFIKKIENEN